MICGPFLADDERYCHIAIERRQLLRNLFVSTRGYNLRTESVDARQDLEMKPLMVFLALLQSAAPFQDQAAQNTTAAIEGFVVRAGTNEPIPRARLTITKMTGPGGAPIPPGPRPTIPAVTTDSQGHFVLKDLDPGSYSVTAQRNGFARQLYGERAPGRPGAPLNLVGGQTLKDVVFHLIPGGTISGRVADVTGEPIAGMTVQLVRSFYDLNGKRTFQTVDSARTDDRGEYRIFWITPGRYYLNVSPRPVVQVYPTTNQVIEPGYVLTYYPGTIDPSRAEIIEVQPGAELSAVDFGLEQKPLFHVRGRIFDTRTGQFPQNASVSINPRTPTGGFTFGTNPANYNAANGTFEIRDVPPGSYWVRAIAVALRTGLTPTDMARNSVQVAIDVTNADIENVSLALVPGFQLKGRVTLNGGSPATLPDIERAGVYLEPIDSLPFGSPQQSLKQDGLFSLEGIPSGDYRVMLVPTPANTFIESIRLGQTDVSSGMTISGSTSDSLEIVLGTKGGLIEGTILDKDQKPMPGVQAVLIPDRQRDRRDAYRFSTADQNGHFTLRVIPPGNYKLFAWEDLEPGAYYDPEFIRKYEDVATRVTVSESAALNIAVKVLPAN
jgi:hypothetical protein